MAPKTKNAPAEARQADGAAAAAESNGHGAQRVPPRLKERYRSEIAPAMLSEFSYPNVMQVPGVTKIVVNMGVGEAARDAKLIGDGAVQGPDHHHRAKEEPAVAKARKSIAPSSSCARACRS